MASTRKLTKSLTRSLTRKLTGAELQQLFLDKFKFTLSDTELVTNGTFDADSNWTKGTGWSIANGVAASDGSQSANSGLIQYNVHTSGKKYTLTFDVVSTNGEQIKFWVNGAQNIFTSALGVGTHTYTYTSLHTGTAYFEASSAFVGSIDNVSVKEAIKQAPVAAFSLRKLGDVSPYAARIRRSFDNTEAQVMFDASDRVSESSVVRNTSMNLIPFSEDFSNSAWSKNASTITSSSETDPFGGTNAYKLTLNSSGDGARVSDTFSSSAGNYTFSVYVKKGTAPEIKIGFNDEGVRAVQLRFNFDTAQQTFLSNVISHSITSLENDWYRISVTGTIDASGTDTFYIRGTAGSTSSGDTVHIFGAMLEETVTYESTNGTEKVTNGTFDSTDNWTVQSHWAVSGGVANYNDTGNSALYQSVSIKAGFSYRLRFDISNASTTARLWIGNLAGTNAYVAGGYQSLSNGSYDYTFTVSQDESELKFFGHTDGGTFSLDNVSVLEFDPIPSEYISTPTVSNDGLQFTESTLDTFVGGENLRKYSNEFNAASWGITNFNAAENNNIANPINGAVDAMRLRAYDTGGAAKHEFYTRYSATSGVQYAHSIYLKPFGTVTHVIGSDSGSSGRAAAFDLVNGTVVSNGLSNQGASIEAVGSDGWMRVTFVFTATATISDRYIYWAIGDATSLVSGNARTDNYDADGTGQGVYAWGSQVNLGTTAKAHSKTEATIRDGNAAISVLYNQTGGEDAIQSTTGRQPLLYNAGLLVRSGTSPAWEYPVGNPQRNLRVQGVEGVSTLDAFFVAETSDAALGYPVDPSVGYRYGLVVEDSSTNTTLSSAYGSPVLEINGVQQSPSTRDDVHTAYQGRKLVYHRSASTSGWGNVDMGHFAGITNYSLNIENTKFSEWIFFDSDQHSNQAAIESDIADFHNIALATPPSSSTTTYTIANGADDGSTFSNSTSSTNVQFNGSISKNSSIVFAGAQDDEGDINYMVSYFRFTNVAIDQGATVQSAILKPIKKSSSGSESKDFEIAARDVDNAGEPSSASQLGTRTTARVTVLKSTVFDTTNGNRFDTPDIKTVIQEIVDRAGWSSGNSILLVLYTPTQNVNSPIEARFGTKDGATDESAQLVITI